VDLCSVTVKDVILHYIPDMFGEPMFESMDVEITILEMEYNCFVKVGVYWLKNWYRIQEVALLGVDVGLSDGGKLEKYKNLWLADSGAYCHMTFDKMFDCREVTSKIKIGNSQMIAATKIGKKRIQIISQDGKYKEFVLEKCKLIPDLWVDLFSLIKSMSKRWNLSNKEFEFCINKRESKYSV
jgi:hypothetical protein